MALFGIRPLFFLGPLAKFLKTASDCRSYLIVRDIFPEWAVDLGIIGKGLPYYFFRAVARYQYAVADTIGVQTPGNLAYFDASNLATPSQVEVLQNWLEDAPSVSCPISIARTTLAGRKIFVYAGNMGIAQGMGILIALAARLRARHDIGFLFVGRGAEAKILALDAQNQGLDNVLFFDEIHPDEIPGLYAQCSVGLIALDTRHKSHNIPGKFLTYMQSGLPVLASINAKNDLAGLIRDEKVGCVCEDGSVDTLERIAIDLIGHIEVDVNLSARCKALYKNRYMPSQAVKQITAALAVELDN